MEILPEYLRWAKSLHQSFPVVDAHLDLAGELLLHRKNGEQNVLRNHYLDKFQAAGIHLVVSSVYVENQYLPEMGLRAALEQIAVLLEEIDVNPEFLLVKTREDLRLALSQNRIGVLLYLEGMDFLGTDNKLLRVLWELGVRGASLTWSRRNALATGCCTANKLEQIRGGLSLDGIKMVQKMEEMGMFLDVSHLNDDGFEDICQIAKKPFLATHSNSRTVYFNYRNLTDEQMRKLAEKGGMMGTNGCTYIVGCKQGRQAILRICHHIEHEVEVIGADRVGYGFDFCDAYDDAKLGNICKKHQNDCLIDHSHIVELTAALLQRGMLEESVKKIIGGNFISYFMEWLPQKC